MVAIDQNVRDQERIIVDSFFAVNGSNLSSASSRADIGDDEVSVESKLTQKSSLFNMSEDLGKYNDAESG